MSIIYLARHAHAESSGSTDAERPLSASGRQEARRLGALLQTADERPGQFVSSSAVRARQTAEEVAAGAGWDGPVPMRSVHALYEAEPADVLEAIRGVDPSLDAVMLVGHEPSWSATVSRLIGSAQVSLPPGTCVRIDSPQRWDELVFGAGTLRWMVPPSLTR
jgi:phosphohistidine phosphatase